MRWMAGVVLAACTFVACAAGPQAVRRQVEASMWVTGTVEVDALGTVTGYRLKDPDRLPPEVVALVQQRAPDWLFEPHQVQGRPVASTATMNLRIAARRPEPYEGRYVLDIVGAGFYVEARDPAEQPSARAMPPPSYPRQAAAVGAQGTVYLLLKVGRDGAVQEAIDEQVNLKFVTDEGGMDHLRRVLASAALAGARRWTFQPPTAGDAVDAPFWTLRVPVAFYLEGAGGAPAYGAWDSYVPGPRQQAPWQAAAEQDLAFAPDALPGSGLYPVDGVLRLRADHGS